MVVDLRERRTAKVLDVGMDVDLKEKRTKQLVVVMGADPKERRRVKELDADMDVDLRETKKPRLMRLWILSQLIDLLYYIQVEMRQNSYIST